MTVGQAFRLIAILVLAQAFGGATSGADARTVQIAAPGGGEVRALVIGVNNYSGSNIATLKGAVADARDLENTLRAAGVADLKVLLEADANRKNVVAAVDRLIGGSKFGDLVIVSFAGHGSQQSEFVKGSEPDGMDEIFLLSGFSWKGPGTADRIVDDEFNAWLSQLMRKGVDVLFIADTCHGGGLLRAPDWRSGELTYRFTPTVPLVDDDLKPISTANDAQLTAANLPNVTFLGAVDKYTKAPEVVIPGNITKRGALTYSVARSIEKGRDGDVTRAMLFGAARQIVYQYSNTQQTIYTEPSNDSKALEKVVFRLKVSGDEVRIDSRPEIKLRVIGDKDGRAQQSAKTGFARLRVVGNNEASDLTWDMSRGEVLNSSGDVVADCRTVNDLGPIIDRAGAADVLSQLAERSPQTIRLTSDGKRFSANETVAFKIEELSGKHLILFDLAGDGTVQFLYPKLAKDQALISDPIFVLPLRVSEPFGADYFVAIASERRLFDLEAFLSASDKKKVSGEVAQAIQAAYRLDQKMSIGLAAVFTGR